MAPDFSIASTKTVEKRIAANARLLIGSKAMGSLMGIGTLIIASMVLEPALFGTVVALHAYMLFFGEVTTFKNWQAIIRFGSEDAEHQDVEGFSRLIKFTAKLDVLSVIFAYILAVLLMSTFVWFLSVFPEMQPDDLDVGLLKKWVPIYCAVLFLRLIGSAYGILRLFDRFGLIAIEAVSMPFLRLTGSIYVWQTGGGFAEFIMVWFIASGVSYLLLIFFAVRELSVRSLLGPVIKARQKLFGTRRGLWPFALKANIDSSIASGFMHLPLLLVSVVFGPAWGAVYKIAEEVMKLLSEGFKLLDHVVYPELAKFVAQGAPSKIWPVVRRASSWMLLIGLSSSIFIWFAGPQAIAWIFGEEYRQSGNLAAILVPGATLLGMVTPIYSIYYAANKPERAIYVRGGALIVYICTFFMLAKILSPVDPLWMNEKMAPAWAIVVANLFAVILALWMARVTLRPMVKAEKQNAFS